jgi:hypothetical protein
MESIGLARITGHANAGNQQFLQVATTEAQSIHFWAFTPLNGDAVIAALTNEDGTSALGYWRGGTKTAYQNVLYTGSFKAITLTSGIVKLELSQQ